MRLAPAPAPAPAPAAVALVLGCLALPTAARAQVAFPPDPAWSPLRCGGAPMSDRLADQPGALDDRDLVGDAAAPAGLRASDETYLYLRVRLDEDPAPGGALRAGAWGMQFDLDGDRATYELMVLADGLTGPDAAVALLRNTATTQRNDPRDPADQPAVAAYPFAMNARAAAAAGPGHGGGPDFFLDLAVPWSALAPLGLGRDTPTYVWAGSSSVATGLDGDLACHDGAGGPAQLEGAASDPTTGDPDRDPNGGGAGRLEGGGGCAAGGGGALGALTALAPLALLASRARRRRIRR